MDQLNPIYTKKTECQDCYKCVRHCPVKAIKVEDGNAIVMPELCILCGTCVDICPSGAKKIRNDLMNAQRLLIQKDKVIISLAPSYLAEFDGITKRKLISAIKQLGFFGVSETALGAQIVSSGCAEMLNDSTSGVYISSACPVINEFVLKYYPQYKNYLTKLISPVQVHSKMLREVYGEDVGIVFASPCIAKKNEVIKEENYMDVAITFEDLHCWFDEFEIDFNLISEETNAEFVPYEAEEGSLYPVEGGMIDGILANRKLDDVTFISFSGIKNVDSILKGLNKLNDEKVFLELLSCEGGCINGHRINKENGIGKRAVDVKVKAQFSSKNEARELPFDISTEFTEVITQLSCFSDKEIMDALRSIGKYSHSDELNCGGCGYNDCRNFAVALLDSRAESSMCVSYMRKLAMNKANALLRKIPAGVVIVNDELRIIECNEPFVKIAGESAEIVHVVNPGLENAYLDRIVPFSKYFSHMFNSKDDEFTKIIKHENKIIKLSLFTIEKNRIVGSIVQDITNPYVQRDHVINKAREVIHKSLNTVQQIAFLLGENASESEVLLEQIIDSFSPDKADDLR
ncbi:MAG: 4Fe-4S binding protein [Candidatus Cloacimonetes bacterium]|nr:4Fe-4S binding protein [Candidatus Cloacimonadota bacterium]